MRFWSLLSIATLLSSGVAVETAQAKRPPRLPSLMLVRKPTPKRILKKTRTNRSSPKAVSSKSKRRRLGKTQVKRKSRSKSKRKSKSKSKRRRRRRDLWPPMKLAHVNTKEKLTVRLYDRKGRTIRASVRKIERLMRCHYTNKRRRIHWRLIRNLYKISRRFKGKTIRIISGYRHRRVARSRTSNHVKGKAVDFYVSGVNKRVLRDYLRSTFKKCGVGYYPNSFFVHFDIRKKRAFWVDVSGTGEDPKYVKNAYTYLKKERHRGRTKTQVKKARDKEKAREKGDKRHGKVKEAVAKETPPKTTQETAQKTSQKQPEAKDGAAVVSGPPPVGPGPGKGRSRSAPPASESKLESPKAPPDKQPNSRTGSENGSPRVSSDKSESAKPTQPAKGSRPTKPTKPTATKEKGGSVSNIRGAS